VDASAAAAFAGAAGALVGGALVAATTLLVQRSQRRERAQDQLLQAATAFLASIDAITHELHDLPTDRGVASVLDRRIRARFPRVSFVTGRANRALFGRRLVKYIDRFHEAANRLALVAPEHLLASVGEVVAAWEEFRPGDERWQRDWSAARGALQRAARSSLE
jgi:hypothetical protein